MEEMSLTMDGKIIVDEHRERHVTVERVAAIAAMTVRNTVTRLLPWQPSM
jgi:hypothetical protein